MKEKTITVSALLLVLVVLLVGCGRTSPTRWGANKLRERIEDYWTPLRFHWDYWRAEDAYGNDKTEYLSGGAALRPAYKGFKDYRLVYWHDSCRVTADSKDINVTADGWILVNKKCNSYLIVTLETHGEKTFSIVDQWDAVFNP